MLKCEEKSVTISGFNIALKAWHSNQQRPVLCLHGKLDNAASFDLLAPWLSQSKLVAVDYPGTGLSSPYPEGVMPYWKNDAFLILQLIKSLGWEQFDIVAHSLGALLAAVIAIAQPKQVRKIVFLDILGPTVKFSEQGLTYLHDDAQAFLSGGSQATIYPDEESVIQVRMKIGNISYQAAKVLVKRGVVKQPAGWVWTYDRRLHSVNSTLPYEDELRMALKGIAAPVCLVRAKHGVAYPEAIFRERAALIKNLTIHEVNGGHHVHMDNPQPVAEIISQFLV